MDDRTFLALACREPFGTCSDAEWGELTGHLLASLSQFLGVPLEFVGGRRPDGDNFSPLVRSVGDVCPALGVQLAGMISCWTPRRDSGLQIEALLFLFVHGQRVAPPGLVFLTCKYLGLGGGPEWAWQGWQTSDFGEQWAPYTHRRFFGGAEAELPGAGPGTCSP